MSPENIRKAVSFLCKIPQIGKFCCIVDLRIGAAVLASVGIILDIHIFNASISITMICLTDFHNALGVEVDEFCAQIWFLTLGGLISFVSGILYIGVTIPALVCDGLQLFGMIPVRIFSDTLVTVQFRQNHTFVK